MKTNDLGKLINFISEISKLKKTQRFDYGSKELSESVADHSWRLTILAASVYPQLNLKLDCEKAMKMALIHDVGEYGAGDIDYRRIATGERTLTEKKAVETKSLEILKEICPTNLGDEIYDLWIEFEDGKTPEAKYVRALDKLETLMHICERGYKTFDIPELIPVYADKAVKNFPELKPILKLIKNNLRKEYKKGGIKWKKEWNNI
jgi:putative hydrolase of HD superfamily